VEVREAIPSLKYCMALLVPEVEREAGTEPTPPSTVKAAEIKVAREVCVMRRPKERAG